MFGEQRLSTCDLSVIAHLYRHEDTWVMFPEMRTLLSRVMGAGVMTTEHDQHRRQRRVLKPAFNAGSIKNLTPTIYDKAWEMQAKLVRIFEDDGKHSEEIKLDMQQFIADVAIDIIALAIGFEFGATAQDEHEVATAFREMMAATVNFTPFAGLQLMFPILYNVVSLGSTTSATSTRS
jgi:cytochrome P450